MERCAETVCTQLVSDTQKSSGEEIKGGRGGKQKVQLKASQESHSARAHTCTRAQVILISILFVFFDDDALCPPRSGRAHGRAFLLIRSGLCLNSEVQEEQSSWDGTVFSFSFFFSLSSAQPCAEESNDVSKWRLSSFRRTRPSQHRTAASSQLRPFK